MNRIKPETHPASSLIDTDVNLEKSKSLDLGLEQIKSKPFKSRFAKKPQMAIFRCENAAKRFLFSNSS